MTTGEERARLHLVVNGCVQGVFYRHSTMQEAQQLGLNGWVRNLSSGEVEIMAEGKRRNLAMLLAWTYTGPPLARVTEVREEWSEYRGEFVGFRVR